MVMNRPTLKGMIPAAIVPMDAEYAIDFAAYRSYLEWLVRFKPVGLAINVDTGENAFLTPDERAELIRIAASVAGGTCAVVAGIGGPGTASARRNAKEAAEAGADALLVFPTPAFLNDPLDPVIAVDYHEAVAAASGLPLIVFQLSPQFGGTLYPHAALDRLLHVEAVIAIKEASFDAQHFVRTRDLVRAVDREITLLSGNDTFLLESFVLGAQGALLGFGAVGAGLLNELWGYVVRRDFTSAAAMQSRVQGFCDYIYGPPLGDYRARCKVALVHMGLLDPALTFVRPPYVSLWTTERERAAVAVRDAGLRATAAATT
jgi:4-hydroxy-tetrahydrodipicolinate synthase